MRKTIFSVDIETDGPAIGTHSMIWFGVVRVDEVLQTTFEGKLAPISNQWISEALAVSGLTRNETLNFPSPLIVMPKFAWWLRQACSPGTQPELWSDNPGFDWGFLNFYFWRYVGENPFGYKSVDLKHRYRGLMEGRGIAGMQDLKYIRRSYKHLIKTPHDHNPVNDARGNAEAILGMRQYGLRIVL